VGDLLCFFERFDAAPIMGRRIFSAVATVSKGQEKKVRRSMLSIPAPAALSDTNKAECFGFSNCRRDRRSVHAVGNKVIGGNRKAAVVVAAVMSQLDFDARYYQMARKGERPISRRLEHFNRTR